MNINHRVLNEVRHQLLYLQKLELYKNVTQKTYNQVLEQLSDQSYTSTMAFVLRKLYDEY
jgi:hypothetical protein